MALDVARQVLDLARAEERRAMLDNSFVLTVRC
jgi:hypothetical protein